MIIVIVIKKKKKNKNSIIARRSVKWRRVSKIHIIIIYATRLKWTIWSSIKVVFHRIISPHTHKGLYRKKKKNTNVITSQERASRLQETLLVIPVICVLCLGIALSYTIIIIDHAGGGV